VRGQPAGYPPTTVKRVLEPGPVAHGVARDGPQPVVAGVNRAASDEPLKRSVCLPFAAVRLNAPLCATRWRLIRSMRKVTRAASLSRQRIRVPWPWRRAAKRRGDIDSRVSRGLTVSGAPTGGSDPGRSESS
jgi:hypothetical protein